MPLFTAAGGRSSARASIWRVTSSAGNACQARTSTVFCAVTAVTTLVPNTPNWGNVFRSAWMPAPPPESEPAMVRATFTLAPFRSRAVAGLGRRSRQCVHRALQLVKHRGVLAAGLPRGARGRIRRDGPLDVGDAIGRHGMRREKLLDGPGVLALHLL